jgi:two-component system, chemotaxis family, chemotaxis protein CheY
MCKILIIDDEPDTREVVRTTLIEGGHEVCEADNGRTALDLLAMHAKEPPCVVLLDLRMPVMDGWDFVAALRSHPRWKDIPLVVFSAAIGDGLPPLLGAKAYWPKPPPFQHLEHLGDHCRVH